MSVEVSWALVSMAQRWRDKVVNLERCAWFAAAARDAGCSLVIFPEMTLTGYSMDIEDIVEEEECSETLARFGELADSEGIDIIFGACLSRKGRRRPRNAFCLATPGSGARLIYEKIHPFSFAGEDAVFGAGDQLGLVDAGGARIGAAICYDLRFPELYSVMAPASEVIVTIANWPEKRVAHWRTLLRARAIENQCYIVGVNRVGDDGNGLSYVKSSLVVTPEGKLLEPEMDGDEMDVYRLDPALVADYREAFPTVRDKRYSLYRVLLESSIC